MDTITAVVTMKEETNEMEDNYDIGSLEYVGIPGCMKVEMEEPDLESHLPEMVVVEKTGTNKRQIVTKAEDEVILEDNIVGKVEKSHECTATATTSNSVESLKMEYSDEDDVFEEAENDINLQEKNSRAMQMPISTSEQLLVTAIKQEDLIKSEDGGTCDVTNHHEGNFNFKPCLTSSVKLENDLEIEHATQVESHNKQHKDVVRKYEECAFQTKFEPNLGKHKLQHTKMFACDKCDFQTRQKHHLKRHMIRHKSATEVEMFNCGECDYQAKFKDCLKTHMLRHRSATEVEMFSCEECNYQSRRKCNLQRHMLRHKSATEVEIFSCGECDYQSRQKHHLKEHMIRHKSATEVETFSCGECDYQSRSKGNLQKHMLRHRSVTEIKMFRCGECDHQSRLKRHLKRHMIQHKSATEVERFSCGECDFQTKYKNNLTVHKLRHKSTTEVETFSCGECDYQSKLKGNLKKHMLRHHRRNNK